MVGSAAGTLGTSEQLRVAQRVEHWHGNMAAVEQGHVTTEYSQSSACMQSLLQPMLIRLLGEEPRSILPRL